MTTKPILFNSEMVRAILDGRKTQTRRVIKPQIQVYYHEDDLSELIKGCPYGQVGDRLWVRESFTYWESPENGEDYLEYRDGVRRSLGEWDYPHPIYDHCVGRFGKWTPSVHAPRWASRITLEITGVRVERLHDISEKDAIAEGIETKHGFHMINGLPKDYFLNYLRTDRKAWIESATESFQSLWQSINAKKHPWESNPWVWVIEFKRVN